MYYYLHYYRLEVYSCDIIGEYQTGFVRGKSTSNHISTISQVLKKYNKYGKDANMPKHGHTNSTLLDYADDIVILGNTQHEVATKTDDLKQQNQWT